MGRVSTNVAMTALQLRMGPTKKDAALTRSVKSLSLLSYLMNEFSANSTYRNSDAVLTILLQNKDQMGKVTSFIFPILCFRMSSKRFIIIFRIRLRMHGLSLEMLPR